MIQLKNILNETTNTADKVASIRAGTRHTFANGTTLTIGKNVVFVPETLDVVHGFLTDLVNAFPGDKFAFNSAYRDEYNQSRVMYNNWRTKGRREDYLTGLYKNKSMAKEMHAAFVAGETKTQSINKGEQVLLNYRAQGRHISRHQLASALDISGYKQAAVQSWINRGGSSFAESAINEGDHIHIRLKVSSKFPTSSSTTTTATVGSTTATAARYADKAMSTKGLEVLKNKELKKVTELKVGDKGTSVEELQSLLAELGYEFTDGPASDFKLKTYGDETRDIVYQFQTNAIINISNDGVADKTTINRLLNLTSSEKTTIKQENEAPPEEREREEVEKVTGVSFKIDRDRIDFKRSIAGEDNRNNTCLVIYGGTPNSKYGPRYLVDQMPVQISRIKDIIYVQGDSKNWPISRIQNYVPNKSVIDAVIGFSAGGNRVFPLIENDYNFIGLIDPSVPKRYETIMFKDNVYMFGNPSNWTGQYSYLGKRIQTIIDNNKQKIIYKDYDHFTEMVPEFLKTYKSKII
jgi:peptidoglycan hydrolase-like protein with peptidoglycan-binding domain